MSSGVGGAGIPPFMPGSGPGRPPVAPQRGPAAGFPSTPVRAAGAPASAPFSLSGGPDIWNIGMRYLDYATAPAPDAPDYTAATEREAAANQEAINRQTRANRPNQSNPYASSTWTQGPDGSWSQSSQFSGPLAGLNAGLQQQAAQAMSAPFSLDGLPALSTGEQARQQAIDAAYGQATSRLDPQFQQRENQLRTRLLNQGLSEGSQAYKDAMADFGRQRNDAYGGALSSAIGQGTAAGNALFTQSLAGRQNALAEALRGRGQAFSELGAMQGLLGQQGFQGAGMAQAPDYLAAAGLQDAARMERFRQGRQDVADLFGAGGQGLSTLMQIVPFLL